MEIEGVGEVVVHHKLVNSLHDGKERLAMTQHLVKEHPVRYIHLIYTL